MKKMKKALALILAMTMVLGMGLTTMAASQGYDEMYGTEDDRGTITVTGITQESDNDAFGVYAYQIVKATYDETTGIFSGYKALYPDISVEADSNGVVSFTQDQLDSIRNKIEAGNMAEGAASGELTYVSGTTFKTSDNSLPVGSYLIVVRGAETKVYNSAVASIVYDASSNVVDDDLNIIDGSAWLKVTNAPDITKTVSEPEEGGTPDNSEVSNGNSVNIGDTVKYSVKIDPIPYYGGSNPVLNVVDTLSEGLTYTQGTLSVTVDNNPLSSDVDEDTEANYYHAEITGDTITVNFVLNGKYTLNEFAGQSVIISYDATVNNLASVNVPGNENTAKLHYTVDSTLSSGEKTDESKTYTYTFDINGMVRGTTNVLTKVGEDIYENALPGATFGLYTNKACTSEYLYINDVFNGSATSNDEGQLEIAGLAAGTYYLKEISAPEGYSVNNYVYEIIIAAKYDSETGKLDRWTITIDGEATSTFDVAYDNEGNYSGVTEDVTGTEIHNTKLSTLPSTGGIGTTIFTVGGCVIMIAAAALFFMNRRKSEE